MDIAVCDGFAGNLAGRRARISGTESLSGGLVTVKADMPLSSLSDYHTELKSMSQGQGTFTMEYSHYDPVPHSVQQPSSLRFHLVSRYQSRPTSGVPHWWQKVVPPSSSWTLPV